MADFILGRLKFHFKGDWATSTVYIKDDVVRHGGNTFVAMVNDKIELTVYIRRNINSNAELGVLQK